MWRYTTMLSILLWAGQIASAICAEHIPPEKTVASSTGGHLIDDVVRVKLAAISLEPSALTSDTDFLRRLWQTTVGQLPPVAEIRAFVTDVSPDKRARKIDELLQHDLHAALWATHFSELTGNSVKTLAVEEGSQQQYAQLWHDWLRTRFAENQPYDQLVRDIITAQSRGNQEVSAWVDEQAEVVRAAREQKPMDSAHRATLDLFWRRTLVQNEYPTRELAERIASAFLGVRINCARCHDHPFAAWTQHDYQAFVRIFEQVHHDMSPDLRREVASRLAERRRRSAQGEPNGLPLPRMTEVYLLPLDDDPQKPSPQALGGPLLPVDGSDLRVAFMDWVTTDGRKTFARNFVNRLWAHYFGRGLAEPLDNVADPSAVALPELLDALADRFLASGYDIRDLERQILNSNAWQRSSLPTPTNRDDQRYFSRALVRLPAPEVTIDMWHAATGAERDFGHEMFRGRKAIELGPDRLPNNRWDAFRELFGQADRTVTCDCNPRGRPAVRQALAMMCDSRMLADIHHSRLLNNNAHHTDDELIDDLFLQTLGRWPSADERQAAKTAIQEVGRESAAADILWSLVNTQEFITIH